MSQIMAALPVDKSAEFVYHANMEKARETKVVGGRISLEIAERLDAVTDRKRNPLAPSIGRIVARGVELVVEELERKRPSKS